MMLPFAGRGARGWLFAPTDSFERPNRTLIGGRNGARNAWGMPFFATTTCWILVIKGLDALPAPSGMEAKALARIEATPGLRLAWQCEAASKEASG